MATKKKASDAIPGFHAVAASRRWRVATGKRLAAMTPAQRREHLRKARENFLLQKSRHRVA